MSRASKNAGLAGQRSPGFSNAVLHQGMWGSTCNPLGAEMLKERSGPRDLHYNHPASQDIPLKGLSGQAGPLLLHAKCLCT